MFEEKVIFLSAPAPLSKSQLAPTLVPPIVLSLVSGRTTLGTSTMGVWSYFKPGKKVAGGDVSPADAVNSTPTSTAALDNAESVSGKDSLYSNDVQRDIILSYLFQRQCTSMWIQDVAGTNEGVMLKNARNDFLTMPLTLKGSLLQQAVSALNTKVRLMSGMWCHAGIADGSTGCNDCQKPSRFYTGPASQR